MNPEYGDEIVIQKEVEPLSPEDIKLLVDNSPKFAVKCLKTLFDYQTREEQQIEETKEDNGVGFSGADGNILTSFAKQVLSWESEKEHRYPNPLSPKQMALLTKKLKKYAKQLSKALKPEGDTIKVSSKCIDDIETVIYKKEE